jgi:hypothetical protein
MFQEIFDFKSIAKLVLLFCGVYLFSFLGYIFPILNNLIFWIIIFVALALSLKKLEYGILILLSELFIGAKGYLFSFNLGGFVISLRLALFVLIFLVWLFQKNKNKFKFVETKFFLPFALLTIMFVLAVARGLYFGNPVKHIFFDANGYLYFALIFFLFSITERKYFIKKSLQCLVSAGIAVGLLTLYVSAGFTILHPDARPDKSGVISFEFGEEREEEQKEIAHSITAKEELKSAELFRNLENQKPAIYRWTRDAGIGDLAFVSGRLFRFFTSAQIYSLFALTFFVFYAASKTLWSKKNLWYFLAILIMFLGLVIGFSRSLWLGMLASLIYFLLTLPWKKAVKIALLSICFILIFVSLINIFTPSIASVLNDRAASLLNPQTQSTAVTRMNMLQSAVGKIKEHIFLGSGFGTSIQYESVIPGQTGSVRVFVFEWGYLDMILKLGLLGLAFYLWLIYVIFKLSRKKKENLENRILKNSLAATLVGLLVVNITTPYLNHPLGIGYIGLVAAILYLSDQLNFDKA